MPDLGDDPPITEATFNQALILFLNELRVALTGAQLLVAFLLSVPFTSQFSHVDELDHHIYFVAFGSALISVLLLIAPSVFHRMHLRRAFRDPVRMMRSFNRFAVTGSMFLAIAMTAVTFIVTRFVYHRLVAVGVSVGAAVGFGWFWFGLPHSRHRGQK
jgi:uncharacterized protein DUF6328